MKYLSFSCVSHFIFVAIIQRFLKYKENYSFLIIFGVKTWVSIQNSYQCWLEMACNVNNDKACMTVVNILSINWNNNWHYISFTINWKNPFDHSILLISITTLYVNPSQFSFAALPLCGWWLIWPIQNNAKTWKMT